MGKTRIIFSAQQAGAALWTYGEDDLVDSAVHIADENLPTLWDFAGDHWCEDHGLPLNGRLVLDKVTAFAAIAFLEGQPRPLRQERRRSHGKMPEQLREARPVPHNHPALQP